MFRDVALALVISKFTLFEMSFTFWKCYSADQSRILKCLNNSVQVSGYVLRFERPVQQSMLDNFLQGDGIYNVYKTCNVLQC